MIVESPRRERKVIGGHVLDTKEGNDNGVPIGIVAGYIATWDIDEGNDRFKRGAFKSAIQEHRDRGNRKVRMNYNHWEGLIGGFPVDGDNPVKEDSRGLWGEGHIVLSDPVGLKTYHLARAGVLTDFSVGYSAKEFSFKETGPDKIRIREIQTSGLHEGSVVDEPMNRAANVTSIKSLEVVSPDSVWREYQGADERAFLSHSGLAIGSEVDGKLVICPSRLQDVAKELMERGDPDHEDVRIIERHMAAANVASPFPVEHRSFWRSSQIFDLDIHQLERVLKACPDLSRGAARKLAEALEPQLTGKSEPVADLGSIFAKLQLTQKSLDRVTV